MAQFIYTMRKVRKAVGDKVILDDVTLSFRTDVADTLLPQAEVEDALRDFCARLLRRLATPDAVGAWRLVAGETGRFPEVGRVFRTRVICFAEEALTEFFRLKIEQRILRDEDTAGMTHFLLSLCWGCQNKRAWGDAEDLDSDGLAADFAAWFMRAFGAQGQQQSRRSGAQGARRRSS